MYHWHKYHIQESCKSFKHGDYTVLIGLKKINCPECIGVLQRIKAKLIKDGSYNPKKKRGRKR